jgi:hypothetical protein
LLPKLWDPSSGVKQARKNTAWALKVGPETSVTNWRSTLRKSQESEDLIYTVADAWNHAK